MTTSATSANHLHGLTEDEALERRSKGLGNSTPPVSGRTHWTIVRENVFTFVNNAIFLVGIALVLVGKPMDALVSESIILVNVVVSAVQLDLDRRSCPALRGSLGVADQLPGALLQRR
jgi:hypothetical protein